MTGSRTVVEPLSPGDVDRLRRETPGVAHVRHFNHSGSSLPPQVVLDTQVDYLRREAMIGGYEAAAEVTNALADTYRAVEALVGASPGEVAIVENATRGWDMAVYGIPFVTGDKVITTMSEYGSNVLALMQLQQRGVELVIAPSDDAGQLNLDRLDDLIDSRVRGVMVTHMPTNGGLMQPAAEIGEIVRRRAPDAWYVLDACQTAGQTPLDLQAIQCDVLSATSRKFLRGPRGVGFVAVRSERVGELQPPIIDQHAATWTGHDTWEMAPDARRLENWEFNYAARLGMGRAIRYALDIGVDRIWDRIQRQADHLRRRLRELDGVIVRDLGRVQGGIVTFTHRSIRPESIRKHLSRHRINTSVTGLSSTRFDMEARGLDSMLRCSVHVITSDEEIDGFIDALAELIQDRGARDPD